MSIEIEVYGHDLWDRSGVPLGKNLRFYEASMSPIAQLSLTSEK